MKSPSTNDAFAGSRSDMGSVSSTAPTTAPMPNETSVRRAGWSAMRERKACTLRVPSNPKSESENASAP
jgi:hypothetical protein